MTRPTKKIKAKPEDRNWIKPPNTMVRQGSGNSPKKLSYWTDQYGKPHLYTKEQLAACNILMNLNLLITRSLILLDTIKTLDEDTKIGTILNQDYAKFEATESSAFNHFINLISAVPNITFAEFLGFIVTSSNPQELLNIGKKTLKEVILGKDHDITNFYTSDRAKRG